MDRREKGRGFTSVKDSKIGTDETRKQNNYDYIDKHWNTPAPGKAKQIVEKAKKDFKRPAYYGTIAQTGGHINELVE